MSTTPRRGVPLALGGLAVVIAAAAALKPGDRTTLSVVRDGSRKVVQITLGKQPQRAAT